MVMLCENLYSLRRRIVERNSTY